LEQRSVQLDITVAICYSDTVSVTVSRLRADKQKISLFINTESIVRPRMESHIIGPEALFLILL